MDFKPCGECSACCDGHYGGNSYGNIMGEGRSCVFLIKAKCSVYNDRPDFCRKYQCAWSQYLLHDDMRPDRCGLMVSVENDKETGKQYLKVVEVWKNVPYESYEKLDECAKKIGAKWILVKHRDLNKKYLFSVEN